MNFSPHMQNEHCAMMYIMYDIAFEIMFVRERGMEITYFWNSAHTVGAGKINGWTNILQY